jgi:hypothetical protein
VVEEGMVVAMSLGPHTGFSFVGSWPMSSLRLHAHTPWRKATIVVVRMATNVVRRKATAMAEGRVLTRRLGARLQLWMKAARRGIVIEENRWSGG